MYRNFRLMEGLGDCILAASCIQEYAILNDLRCHFETSPLLTDILSNNPYFEVNKPDKEVDLSFRWVSQIKEQNLYPLHTIQRFSTQLGFYIDPTNLVNLFDNLGNKIVNRPLNNNVCINVFSKEKNRRFIPKENLDFIVNYLENRGYNIIYLGDCGEISSITDIKKSLDILSTCCLFIGPVSFLYHLASSINVKCMTFFSYMPYWKFSHFVNTIPIHSQKKCVSNCEEDETILRMINKCNHKCLATEYSNLEIKQNLERILHE